MNDTELDRLLASATKPRLSEDFNVKLLQRLGSEVPPPSSNVVAFPARKTAQTQTSWPRLLPLVAAMAAALVGGIYLGATTNLSSFISDGSSVASIEDMDLTGSDDLETIEQDNQS
jgi:hypothetical protein